jgi:hypothetical protein
VSCGTGSFTLSSIPLNVYEEYSFMRDQIFWAVNLLMFSWWSEIVIPNDVKDFLSLYLFFALAYAGTIETSSNFLPKIIRLFFRINVRYENVPTTLIEKILRSLCVAVTWPFNLWRWIWRPGDWGGKIEWAPGASDKIKELVLETRKAHDRALLFAFLLTVIITATSVFLCFFGVTPRGPQGDIHSSHYTNSFAARSVVDLQVTINRVVAEKAPPPCSSVAPQSGASITDNADEIEGRTDKVKGLVLRTEFLKKA